MLTLALLALGCAPEDPSRPGDAFLDGDMPVDAAEADAGCTSTTPYCSVDRSQVLACDPASGSVSVVEVCDPGEACIDGACVAVDCTPGTTDCLDDERARICRPDGSGWDVVPCPEHERCNPDTGLCEVPCELRIFILLDQSGSMGGTESPTKWEQARAALATLMTSPTATDVEFGFGVFPDPDDCSVDSPIKYSVPDATAELVDDYFEGSPGGNTPLVHALEYFLTTDVTSNLHDRAYHNAILLVSDGSDTCYVDCEAECGPFNIPCIIACEETEDERTIEAAGIVSSRLATEWEIRTYVVGFGSGVSDEELTAIAENGGTVLGDWIPASDVDDLAAAFETVLDEMLECNPII
jgi:hypothetical protein